MEMCEAWPDELKKANIRVYHDQCKITCLEAELKRVSYFSDDYEKILRELDNAYEDLMRDNLSFMRLKYQNIQDEIKRSDCS